MLGLRTLGLLALSVAVIQATEIDYNKEFLTPMEIHKMRAIQQSQVKPVVDLGKDGAAGFVYGGTAGNTSMPFMVYIESFTADGFSVHQCSGSILNSTWIITAAQCFERANYSTITFGNIDRTSANATNCNITMDAVVIHEKFVYNALENDIALINMSRTNCQVVFGTNIKALPICCPSFFRRKMIMYNSTINVTAFGFGSTDGTPSKVFNTAIIPMSNSTAFCKAQLKIYYVRLASTQICGNGLINHTSGAFGPGDSGGPAVVTSPAKASNTGLSNTVTGMCLGGIISLHTYESYPNIFPFTMTNIQPLVRWVYQKTKAKPPRC